MTDVLDVAAGDDRARPLLLGEAPSKLGDRYHHFPLSGRPARVLCELAGIPPQAEGSTYGRWTWALYEHFECRNVFARYATATPWSAPRARAAALELLAKLEATARVDIDEPEAAIPATVVVCLGRKVQAAVLGALKFRYVTTQPGAWATGVFGDFGVWAAPWHIHTPIVRQVCARCGEPRRFGNVGDMCPGETSPPIQTVHVFADRRETRWAPHVVTIPHPSGLNRLLNDEEHRARCGDVLRRALELAETADTFTA